MILCHSNLFNTYKFQSEYFCYRLCLWLHLHLVFLWCCFHLPQTSSYSYFYFYFPNFPWITKFSTTSSSRFASWSSSSSAFSYSKSQALTFICNYAKLTTEVYFCALEYRCLFISQHSLIVKFYVLWNTILFFFHLLTFTCILFSWWFASPICGVKL